MFLWIPLCLILSYYSSLALCHNISLVGPEAKDKSSVSSEQWLLSINTHTSTCLSACSYCLDHNTFFLFSHISVKYVRQLSLCSVKYWLYLFWYFVRTPMCERHCGERLHHIPAHQPLYFCTVNMLTPILHCPIKSKLAAETTGWL